MKETHIEIEKREMIKVKYDEAETYKDLENVVKEIDTKTLEEMFEAYKLVHETTGLDMRQLVFKNEIYSEMMRRKE